MKLLKFVYTLILFTVSSFTFAGYYPAKVNADLNLYTDSEFNKPVILVKAGGLVEYNADVFCYRDSLWNRLNLYC